MSPPHVTQALEFDHGGCNCYCLSASWCIDTLCNKGNDMKVVVIFFFIISAVTNESIDAY